MIHTPILEARRGRYIGDIGEILVQYHLRRIGCDVAVSGSHVDLLVTPSNPCFPTFTVECKSALKPRAVGNPKRRPYYKFDFSMPFAEWYAYVALDKELIIFECSEDIMYDVSSRTFPEHEFTEDRMRQSLDRLMEYYEMGPYRDGNDVY